MGCLAVGLILAAAALVVGWLTYRTYAAGFFRTRKLLSWLHESQAHPDWAATAQQTCAGAPFAMPTSGYIGFLWDDSFRLGHRHQGIDIFGGTDINVTPVYAAYPGYLSRLPDWKSSVIIRIPDDPLRPGRQIWTYYTHMADERGGSLIASPFPAGSSEIFVEQGTLLGYQGNFSGTPGNPVGVHLHFSIVLDREGHFLNELEIGNTLDPSPYLGLPLNGKNNSDTIPVCPP